MQSAITATNHGRTGPEGSSLEKLEFPRILNLLAAECRFSVAAERARQITPSGEQRHVDYLLAVTAEAVALATDFPDITVGGARDLTPLLERAIKGGRLQPAELLDVQDSLAASRNLRRSLFRASGSENQFPLLESFAEHLADMPDLEGLIARAISPSGDVLDTASEALSRLRRDMRVAHNRLIDRLNSMVTGSRFAGLLQDSIVTSRDGRYVIPVKTESRGSVPGVVHDTSASGQTLFIEPLEIVDLNNRWRELQIDEQREVERVLAVLSGQVGDRAELLTATVDALSAIDLAIAKARLAFRMGASRPEIWHGGEEDAAGHSAQRISLQRARHPLLDPETVVPIDVALGEHHRILLVTGPNTGGKTVALKTVGLLAMMAQSGLFIPAGDQSQLSVFTSLFVDIGDEQSIQQSLSTFSSHMRNIILMLAGVDDQSLVLLDELGAGTDPQEGSALARAIIEELLALGPLVMATTHYSEVKAFAYETAGVENASVEFDLQTLAPTYRLAMGIPGQSNAVAIAGRLGMPESVLQRARSMVSPDDHRADRLVEEILTRRNATAESLARARIAELEAGEMRQQARQELQTAEQERYAAREATLANSEAELAEIRQLLRRLERDLENRTASLLSLPAVKSELESATRTAKVFKEKHRATGQQAAQIAIRTGDLVHVASLDLDGEIISVEGDEAEVAIGGLRVRQPLAALVRKGKAPDSRPAPASYRIATGPVAPMEIDLRGERAAEIEAILDRYLDNAARGGLPFVRIIHGKGTGALRQEVKRVLRENVAITDFSHAELSQGGDGVTIARFGDN